MSDTIYARIADDNIVEYPVTEAQIKVRSHPVFWYTPCEFDAKPALPKFHVYKENKAIVTKEGNQVVQVTFEVIEMSLDGLFTLLPKYQEGKNSLTPMKYVYSALQPDLDLVNAIESKTRDRVQGLMDQFAQTRGYDSIASAISYAGDSNEKYNKEGTYCKSLRSQTWSALEDYFNQVTLSQVPMPYKWDSILKQLPTMEWPA